MLAFYWKTVLIRARNRLLLARTLCVCAIAIGFACHPARGIIPHVYLTAEQAMDFMHGRAKYSDRGLATRSPWGPTVTEYYFPYYIAETPGVLGLVFDTTKRIAAVKWWAGSLNTRNLPESYYYLLRAHDSVERHLIVRISDSTYSRIVAAFSAELGPSEELRTFREWDSDSSNMTLRHDSGTVFYFERKNFAPTHVPSWLK